MDNLAKNLEKMFNGVIIDLTISSEASHDMIHTMGNFTPLVEYTGSSASLDFTLHTNTFMDPQRILHEFQGISDMARVTSVRYRVDSLSMYAYDIKCTVFDMEKFQSDINDFEWKKFDSEFTAQLEDKLDVDGQ